MSRLLQPPGWDLQSGKLLMAAADPTYQSQIKGRAGHSLVRIAAVLGDCDPPPSPGIPGGFGAFDVFGGYMVLDAWIANRDRHDDNWAILIPPPDSTGRLQLSASYDQSSSLGYNVRESECVSRLGRPGGVEQWARKGTAHRFEHDPAIGPPTLVEHAMAALRLCRPLVRRFWLDKIGDISGDDSAVLERVPEMSDPCRTFAYEVLRINRERLIDAGRDI